MNKVPTKSVDKTPYEYGMARSQICPTQGFRDVSYTAYVKCTSSDNEGAKSNKCKFVGYPKETIGYFIIPPSKRFLS